MAEKTLLYAIFGILIPSVVVSSSVTTIEPVPVSSTARSTTVIPEEDVDETTSTVEVMSSTESSIEENSSEDETTENFVDEEIYYKYNLTGTTGVHDESKGGLWGISDESLDRLICYSVRSFIVVVGILLFVGLITVMTNFLGRLKDIFP